MNLKIKVCAITAIACIAILYLSSITAFARSATYVYDDLNRLTSIDYGNGTVIQYAYDELGNRILVQPSAANLPESYITDPADGTTLGGRNVTINGIATDWTGSLRKVEVSTDGGANWQIATGTTRWSFIWTLPADGTYTLKTRATDNSNNVETPGVGKTYTVFNKSFGKRVWAWGDNEYGQLGDSTTSDKHIPAMLSSIDSVTAVSAGYYHTVALKSDGTVWTWGWNNYGQLGIGTADNGAHSTPAQVGGLTGIIAVAGGLHYTIALKSDGTVWAWGQNNFGQLGDGTGTTDRYTPYQVSGLNNVVAIAAGWAHSIALKSDGTVWTWGYNHRGELGLNTSDANAHPIPAMVNNLGGVVAVGAGAAHTIVLKSDGTVWTWGYNHDGELGNNTVVDKTIPVMVSGLSNVIAVGAGYIHSLALKSDGTVWAWGDNEYGQLGDGNLINKLTPVQVSGLSSITTISAGVAHNVALNPDGTVWTWGNNGYGQIGNNTVNDYTTPPVQISGLSGVTAIAAGHYHTVALSYATDTTSPTSSITTPLNNAKITGINYTITGTASDGSGSGLQKVEVGITPGNGTTTWYQASGTTSWSYSWTLPADGNYTVKSRATDNAGNVETPGIGVSVNVGNYLNLIINSPTTAVTRSFAGDSPYTVSYHYSSLVGTGTLTIFADMDTSWSSGHGATAENWPNEVKLGSAILAQSASLAAGTITGKVIRLRPGIYYVRGLLTDSAGNYAETYSIGTLVVTGTPDGLNDMFKALYNVTDPNADPDNDGLTNLQEEDWGTNPNNADTDGGGVIDSVEVANGTDPTNSSDDYSSTPALYGWFYNKISNQWDTRYTITNYSTSTAWIDVTTYAFLSANKEGHYYTSIPANGTAEIDMANTAFGMTIEDRGSIDVRSTTPLLSGLQHFTKFDIADIRSWDWLHLSELASKDSFYTTLTQAFYNIRQDQGNHFITYIMTKNPTDSPINVTASFYATTSTTPDASASVTIQAHQSYPINPALFTGAPTTGYFKLTCDTPIMGCENFFKQNEANLNVYDYSNAVLLEDGENTATTLYMPWYYKGDEAAGGYRPYIFLNNPQNTTTGVTLTSYGSDGSDGGSYTVSIPAHNSMLVDPYWYATITAVVGSLVITSDQPIFGMQSIQYFNATDGTAIDMTATANLVKATGRTIIASDFNTSTGFATWYNMANFSGSSVTATASYYDQAGNLLQTQTIPLAGHAGITVNISSLNLGSTRGSIKIYEPTGSIYAILNESRNNPSDSSVRPGVRDAGEAAKFTVLQ